MKRSVFRLLAVVLVVGLAVSCGGGGGDGDNEFNFAGTWAYTETITASNTPGIPVGSKGTDTLIIVQDGNNVTVKFGSTGDALIMKGTCDPSAGTFSATGVATAPYAGVRNDISGTKVNDNSMSGTASMSLSTRYVRGSWTAELASRSVAAPGSVGAAGDMSTLLKAIQ